MAEEPEPTFEVFVTNDEAKAKSALGKVFVVGGVPHQAVRVEERPGTIYRVLGIALDPHSRPSAG